MKKILNKTINLLMVVAFVLHMFTPLTVFALDYGTKEILIAWNCNHKICAKTIEVDTYDDTSGTKVFADNYIPSSSLVDGPDVFKASDMSRFGKDLTSFRTPWLIFDGGTDLSGFTDWEDMDDALHGPNPIAGAPRDINPCGGIDGPHSVGHNGDQQFRLVIYDDEYVGVTFDVNRDNFTYYLSGWDPVFANPTYDLASDKDNPTVYTTYLLEKHLSFEIADVGAGEGIASVKALDVSNKGITINVVDQVKCDITFNSNYFSDVVFEVTFASGAKRYIKVQRQFVKFTDNSELVMNEIERKREGYAEFIYPADKSYEDYDVYATYTKNGETVTKKLTAVKTRMIDRAALESNTVIEGMSVDAGENLKSTRYKLDIDKDTDDVTITVTKKDAAVGTAYGGTFGGHGKGVSLDISLFKRVLNN